MHRINDWKYSLLPIAIVAGALVGLIMLQPDFGTSVALLLIIGAMVFAAGLDYRVSRRHRRWPRCPPPTSSS